MKRTKFKTIDDLMRNVKIGNFFECGDGYWVDFGIILKKWDEPQRRISSFVIKSKVRGTKRGRWEVHFVNRFSNEYYLSCESTTLIK